MDPMPRICLVVVFVAGLLAGAVAQGQTPAAPPKAPAKLSAEAEAGRKLFVSYGCWQCHGFEGQGGQAGPRLAPPPLPFAVFARTVRRPPSQMPAYPAKLVSDLDLTQIHAYLTSRPAPPKDIPLLRQ